MMVSDLYYLEALAEFNRSKMPGRGASLLNIKWTSTEEPPAEVLALQDESVHYLKYLVRSAVGYWAWMSSPHESPGSGDSWAWGQRQARGSLTVVLVRQ